VPAFKKGDKCRPENYRQLAILPSFSKIFEVAYIIRLIGFLQHHKLLSEDQFGFQRGKSTTQAIYTFLTSIYEALDNKDFAIGLFYDMSKAFDSMDHILLANTLKELGIRGVALDWISTFLADRQQYVEMIDRDGYSKVRSETRTTNIGVPQGSVLGPILYIIHVNFMSANLGTGTKAFYADDSSPLVTANTMQSLSVIANDAARNMTNCCNHA
jgi:hypothetical protein